MNLQRPTTRWSAVITMQICWERLETQSETNATRKTNKISFVPWKQVRTRPAHQYLVCATTKRGYIETLELMGVDALWTCYCTALSRTECAEWRGTRNELIHWSCKRNYHIRKEVPNKERSWCALNIGWFDMKWSSWPQYWMDLDVWRCDRIVRTWSRWSWSVPVVTCRRSADMCLSV